MKTEYDRKRKALEKAHVRQAMADREKALGGVKADETVRRQEAQFEREYRESTRRQRRVSRKMTGGRMLRYSPNRRRYRRR